MPEMGESVTEGTVLEWHVSEGDSVEEGQTMVEVSTDKVDAEVPAPAAGTVTKILVQRRRGDRGRQADGRDRSERRRRPRRRKRRRGGAGRSVEPAARGALRPSQRCRRRTAAETDGKATTDDASVSAGKELEGGGLEIVMPEMGESVTEGTVLEWHVSEGDQVAEGDTVVEVSTDKVDAEVPAPASGTITKILVGPDETIEVGKPLAEMTKGEAPSGDGAAETRLPSRRAHARHARKRS